MARSLTSLPKVPTAESMLKRIRRRAGIPQVERRKKQRLTIEQINAMGEPELRKHLEAIKKPKDKRSTFVKVLDVIDIPRNVENRPVGF